MGGTLYTGVRLWMGDQLFAPVPSKYVQEFSSTMSWDRDDAGAIGPYQMTMTLHDPNVTEIEEALINAPSQLEPLKVQWGLFDGTSAKVVSPWVSYMPNSIQSAMVGTHATISIQATASAYVPLLFYQTFSMKGLLSEVVKRIADICGLSARIEETSPETDRHWIVNKPFDAWLLENLSKARSHTETLSPYTYFVDYMSDPGQGKLGTLHFHTLSDSNSYPGLSDVTTLTRFDVMRGRESDVVQEWLPVMTTGGGDKPWLIGIGGQTAMRWDMTGKYAASKRLAFASGGGGPFDALPLIGPSWMTLFDPLKTLREIDAAWEPETARTVALLRTASADQMALAGLEQEQTYLAAASLAQDATLVVIGTGRTVSIPIGAWIWVNCVCSHPTMSHRLHWSSGPWLITRREDRISGVHTITFKLCRQGHGLGTEKLESKDHKGKGESD